MRSFRSPAAFRAAIDARLRNRARRLGVPVLAVRRQAALERLMARMARAAPGRWALKGGLALDTRLPDHARASMDMDIDHVFGATAARENLLRAAAGDLGDHAYTRRYHGESTRVRDLVDLILICLFETVNAKSLRLDIESTFAHRDTHSVPDKLPAPPADWARSYAQEARAVAIPAGLMDGYRLTAKWLDPVLQGKALGSWHPNRQAWGGR